MTQIAFLTLFLGLAVGPLPVELTVTGPVATVELLLDGAPSGRIVGPPWKGEIDLGPTLSPHDLVARALDAQGNEIARVQQWLNLPRPPAEVDILLESGPAGRPVAARLTWQSVTGERPSAISVTFDDKPLAVGAEGRIKLPDWNPETSHVLTAELRFSDVLTARRDLVFGGRYGDQVATELTAVPVRLRPGKVLPPPERMAGWFHAGGRPATVAAVEEGPAEILVVRDLALSTVFEKLLAEGSRSRPVPNMRGGSIRGSMRRGPNSGFSSGQRRLDDRRFSMTPDKDETVRFVWPVPRVVSASGQTAVIFDMSQNFVARDGGILWFLARFLPWEEDPARQCLADAVAVAGLQALRANHRRAVLLVLSEHSSDASRSSPALVRRYLDAIRVPLFVWTLDDAAAPAAVAWGGAANVSTVGKMQKAFNRLQEELKPQRIIWIDGRHLPQSIELSAEAAAVVDPVWSAPAAGR